MDRRRPSTSSRSSQDQQSIQNPFASIASNDESRGNSSPSSPHHSPAAVLPDFESAIAAGAGAGGGFPFHTNQAQLSHSSNSIHHRRNNQTHLSAGQNNSNGGNDMVTFAATARPRDPPPASFMGPPRIGSMASRDSAFAAPPVRQATPSINDSTYRSKPVKAVPFKSTALQRDENGNAHIQKPWLEKKDPYIRISYWVTWSLFLLLGFGGSGLAIFFSWRAFPNIPNYCSVLEDNFDTLDPSIWMHEIDLGGFGNHQFDMATDAPQNSYVQNGQLYITPSLTADTVGYDQILDGTMYNLTGCTNTIIDPHTNASIPNPDACGVKSNRTTGTMIPPIMSARLTTKGKFNIAYGKVTVRAKLPRGDWLWPAIWMLPEENFYGEWPMSGEIDIMEARGNGREYPAQGLDYVRGSLNWGPTVFINAVAKTYGWWFERRQTFDQGFHDYTVEWTPDFMWVYIDSRLHRSLDLSFNEPFFDRGDFPAVVTNATSGLQEVLQNPWQGRPNSAPFDRSFYLILNVAVGGTNGWFPDGAGNKPWIDNSKTAMLDFWNKRDDWLPTWGSPEDHSMIIDSVNMYRTC